ncbi:MAG TPA: response regulator transcription factor, partial [Promineifilum sp.]|nr:response regulator transcription factor [Promineifilum sp.]
ARPRSRCTPVRRRCPWGTPVIPPERVVAREPRWRPDPMVPAIMAAAPHIRILVLTMSDDTATVFHALQAGARGYILKGARKADVVRAIRNVFNDEVVFGAAVAQHVIHHFTRVQADVRAEAFPQLSERESEILNLMAQELPNEAIAERLGISLKTVRNHVSNICTKLQVSDRTAAVLRAQTESKPGNPGLK